MSLSLIVYCKKNKKNLSCLYFPFQELAQETQRKEREAAAAATTAAGPNNVTSTAVTTTAPTPYTPDYAAGLVAPAASVNMKPLFLQIVFGAYQYQ